MHKIRSKIHENALATGAPHQTPTGELKTRPRTPLPEGSRTVIVTSNSSEMHKIRSKIHKKTLRLGLRLDPARELRTL